MVIKNKIQISYLDRYMENKTILRTLVLLAAAAALLVVPAAADDQIVGTWKCNTGIPFVASGSGVITFNEDNTAQASGTTTIFGITKSYNFNRLTWEKVSDTRYLGHLEWRTLYFTCSENKITAEINPYVLGGTDNILFNRNIPVTLYRT
ncbi:MAG TPA: hypothetical protein O0X70_02300 [Methanocorpusculum sp.]|nr:hypothetical protein [Methanocorpusculum sp.]